MMFSIPMVQRSEMEENPYTSSLPIWTEACCRKGLGGGRSTTSPPPPHLISLFLSISSWSVDISIKDDITSFFSSSVFPSWKYLTFQCSLRSWKKIWESIQCIFCGLIEKGAKYLKKVENKNKIFLASADCRLFFWLLPSHNFFRSIIGNFVYVWLSRFHNKFNCICIFFTYR